jgi:hypothetical protein
VLPQLRADDVIHLLDFSGGAAFVMALSAAVAEVRLVDHHKTAAEDLAWMEAGAGVPANLHATLDMARSGATLARDVYKIAPLLDARLGAAGAARVLRMYSYVEDNDLWRHALEGSRACAAGLAARALPYDASAAEPGAAAVWEALLAQDADELIREGSELLSAEARAVGEEVARAEVVAIPWGPGSAQAGSAAMSCLAVLTQRPDLRSPLGNALAAASAQRGLAPAGAVVYVEPAMGEQRAAALYKVSLRSIGKGVEADTSAVSRSFGGGGHANASSFTIQKEVWASW